MLKPETLSMAEELRKILGSINGTKRVEEEVALSYIVVVETEKEKEGAQKVADVLISQAAAKGLQLEIVVATEEEINEARNKVMEYINKNITFKA